MDTQADASVIGRRCISSWQPSGKRWPAQRPLTGRNMLCIQSMPQATTHQWRMPDAAYVLHKTRLPLPKRSALLSATAKAS